MKPMKNHKYSYSKEEYFRELTKGMKFINPNEIINQRDLITPRKTSKKFLFKFN
jgi:hypothetical protein